MNNLKKILFSLVFAFGIVNLNCELVEINTIIYNKRNHYRHGYDGTGYECLKEQLSPESFFNDKQKKILEITIDLEEFININSNNRENLFKELYNLIFNKIKNSDNLYKNIKNNLYFVYSINQIYAVGLLDYRNKKLLKITIPIEINEIKLPLRHCCYNLIDLLKYLLTNEDGCLIIDRSDIYNFNDLKYNIYKAFKSDYKIPQSNKLIEPFLNEINKIN